MLGFTRWLGPMLRSKMGGAITRPLGWKIIDAHERLRESEDKESAPTMLPPATSDRRSEDKQTK